MSLSCPRCASDSVQKLSVMYETGTSGFSANTVGFGLGSGHRGGIAIATTEGKSQSLLAQKYGPPKPESTAPVGCLVVLGFVVAIACGAAFNSLVAFWVVMALAGALAIAIGKQVATHNREAYPQARALWERRFICLRCGNIFERASSAQLRQTADGKIPQIHAQTQTDRTYSVRLLFAGPRLIAALKIIRDATGVPILEAKQLAESAPSVIRSNLSLEEAEGLKSKFDLAGASAELIEDDASHDQGSVPKDPEQPVALPVLAAGPRRCPNCGNPIYKPDGSCALCESKGHTAPNWVMPVGLAILIITGAGVAIWLLQNPQPRAPITEAASDGTATGAPTINSSSNPPTAGQPEQVLRLPSGSVTETFPSAAATTPQSPNQPTPESSSTTETSADNSIEMVTRFYQALSSADGAAAASYVVPEKRSEGPLSSAELTAHYSALAMPVQLAEVWPGPNGLVYAHYSYTSATGQKCLATSAVKLVPRTSGLFIDTVSVNEQCQ